MNISCIAHDAHGTFHVYIAHGLVFKILTLHEYQYVVEEVVGCGGVEEVVGCGGGEDVVCCGVGIQDIDTT